MRRETNNKAHLRAELKVNHDDRDLTASDDEDHEDYEEKPEQIIELILPDCLFINGNVRKLNHSELFRF